MTYGLDPKDGTGEGYPLTMRETLGGSAMDYKRPNGKKSKRQVLEDRIERHRSQAEYAAKKLAELEALPDEPIVETGEPNVIWFTKVFQNGSRDYTYAAVKAGDGLWYTTGPNSPKGYTWESLIEWINDGRSAEVWHATGYDSLA